MTDEIHEFIRDASVETVTSLDRWFPEQGAHHWENFKCAHGLHGVLCACGFGYAWPAEGSEMQQPPAQAIAAWRAHCQQIRPV